MTIVVPFKDFLQYDGTNSAACLARLQEDTSNTWEIVSEPTGYLNLRYRPSWMGEEGSGYGPNDGWFTPQVAVGWWFGKRNLITGEHIWYTTNEEYEANYKPLALPGPKLQVGVGVVPLLLAGADAVVTVSFPEPFADEEYSVAVQLMSGANLNPALEITAGPTITDADTVTMTVENTGLISLGGFALVHAVR